MDNPKAVVAQNVPILTTNPSKNDINVWLSYHDLTLQYNLPKLTNPGDAPLNPIVERAALAWNSIQYNIFGDKTVRGPFYRIKNASGYLKPKESTLIIADAGSGRTTLLKLLTQSLLPTSGQTLYNGLTEDEAYRRDGVQVFKYLQYMAQTDCHFEGLTVRETILFAHRVSTRTPSEAYCDELISIFGLQECSNTPVASCSGGQKRRLTLLVSMANPALKVLAADEFNNGLDSYVVERLTLFLKQWAIDHNSHFIAGMNQISPTVYDTFDNIIILAEGNVVYNGPRVDVGIYLESMGLPCPNDLDLPTHILNAVSRPKMLLKEQYVQIVETEALKLEGKLLSSSTTTAGTKTPKSPNTALLQYTPMSPNHEHNKVLMTSFGLPLQRRHVPCQNIAEMLDWYHQSPFFYVIQETLQHITTLRQSDGLDVNNLQPVIKSEYQQPQQSNNNNNNNNNNTIIFGNNNNNNASNNNNSIIATSTFENNHNKNNNQQTTPTRISKYPEISLLPLTIDETRKMYGFGYNASVYTLFKQLMDRQITLQLRNTTMIYARILPALYLSCMFSGLYFQVRWNDPVSTIASLAEISTEFCFSNLNYLGQSILDRYALHSQLTLYPTWCYALVVQIAAIPQLIFEVMIFTFITYFTVGHVATIDAFLTYLCLFILHGIVYQAMYRLISSVTSNIPMAYTIASPVTALLSIVAGLYIKPSTIPFVFKWLHYISPFASFLRATTNNEYLSTRYDYLVPSVTNPGTMERSGDVYLTISEIPIGQSWIIISILYCIIALIILITLTSYFLYAPYHEYSIGTTRFPREDDDLSLEFHIEHAAIQEQDDFDILKQQQQYIEEQEEHKKIQQQHIGMIDINNNTNINHQQYQDQDGGQQLNNNNDDQYHNHISYEQPYGTTSKHQDMMMKVHSNLAQAIQSQQNYHIQEENNNNNNTIVNPILERNQSIIAPSIIGGNNNESNINNYKNNNSDNNTQLQTLTHKLPFTPASLSFHNITFTVDAQDEITGKTYKRTLLQGVTGYVSHHSSLALMGSSGAGKTTLLSTLLGINKTTSTSKVSGDIYVNGKKMLPHEFSAITQFVPQFDNLYPYSTVYETLLFSARLKLIGQEENILISVVEEVMCILGLLTARNLMILKLSPSQKKRVSIGIALCANPSIVYCDEPTTGLTQTEAANVINAIERITRSGRTFIITLHQPSTPIFYSFDSLLLLGSGGYTMYFQRLGRRSRKMIQYMQSIQGVNKLPSNSNPAEWLIDVVSQNMTSNEYLIAKKLYNDYYYNTPEEQRTSKPPRSFHKKKDNQQQRDNKYATELDDLGSTSTPSSSPYPIAKNVNNKTTNELITPFDDLSPQQQMVQYLHLTYLKSDLAYRTKQFLMILNPTLHFPNVEPAQGHFGNAVPHGIPSLTIRQQQYSSSGGAGEGTLVSEESMLEYLHISGNGNKNKNTKKNNNDDQQNLFTNQNFGSSDDDHNQQEQQEQINNYISQEDAMIHRSLSLQEQFWYLFTRAMQFYLREPRTFFLRTLVPICTNIFNTCLYWDLELKNFNSVFSFFAALAQSPSGSATFWCLTGLPVFNQLRTLFYQEQISKYYKPWLFPIVYICCELILVAPLTLTFSLTSYWAINAEPSAWLYMWLNNIILSMFWVVFAMGLSMALSTQGLTEVVQNVYTATAYSLFSGARPLPKMNKVFSFLAHCMPLMYYLRAQMIPQFALREDNLIDVYVDDVPLRMSAKEFVAQHWGFDYDMYGSSLASLGIFITIFMFIALFGATFLRYKF